MARPLSEEKRSSILASATEVIAEQGIGAPTSRIASGAGVAEGSVFTYFPNKDALLNQLYLELKQEVAAELMSGFPGGKKLSERVRHVWMAYVRWAVKNKAKRKTLQQLGVSNCLSSETRQRTQELLAQVDSMLQEVSDHKGLASAEFVTAIMTSLSETTVDFMMQYPAKAAEYAESGLHTFKSAVKLR